VQQLTDVLHRGKLQEVVQVAVVVEGQDGPRLGLQVGEVHDHAAAVLPLDHDLDLVGVAVELAALAVSGQEMGAVDEVGDAETHEPRSVPRKE
jgi:hypothetical protein